MCAAVARLRPLWAVPRSPVSWPDWQKPRRSCASSSGSTRTNRSAAEWGGVICVGLLRRRTIRMAAPVRWQVRQDRSEAVDACPVTPPTMAVWFGRASHLITPYKEIRYAKQIRLSHVLWTVYVFHLITLILLAEYLAPGRWQRVLHAIHRLWAGWPGQGLQLGLAPGFAAIRWIHTERHTSRTSQEEEGHHGQAAQPDQKQSQFREWNFSKNYLTTTISI